MIKVHSQQQADSMEPCLVGPVEKTRLLHTSQGLNPMWARSMHMLVILESNWCLAPCTFSRKKRNRETVQSHSKCSRKVNGMRNAKFVAQPEISHEAADLILRNQAIRTDEKFPGIIHVQPPNSPCCMGTRTCFSAHSVVVL